MVTESLDSLKWAGPDLHVASPVPSMATVRLPQVRKWHGLEQVNTLVVVGAATSVLSGDRVTEILT